MNHGMNLYVTDYNGTWSKRLVASNLVHTVQLRTHVFYVGDCKWLASYKPCS